MQKQLSWRTGALTLLWLALATNCQTRVDDGPTPTMAVTPSHTVVAETATIDSQIIIRGRETRFLAETWFLDMDLFLNIYISVLPTLVQQADSGTNQPATAFPYESIAEYGPADYGKLSGIVFYPPRQTLMAVSDDGHISEIDTDGTLIQSKQTRKKADFESITYHPVTEMLYVAIEGEEVILEVNPHTLTAERDIPIDRMFEGKLLLAPEGDGVEGITFVPTAADATRGSFYLVNQSDTIGGPDPSIVFEVEIEQAANASPKARILRYFTVGITDLSGIDYLPESRRLAIVSDANDLLIEVSLTGEVLASYPLPGKDQEGITMDRSGFLYIAQDRKETLRKFTVVQ